MAVAPVPDERLYDTIYQERYMGLPQENEAAYHDGSPLFFADRLRGNLLSSTARATTTCTSRAPSG